MQSEFVVHQRQHRTLQTLAPTDNAAAGNPTFSWPDFSLNVESVGAQFDASNITCSSLRVSALELSWPESTNSTTAPFSLSLDPVSIDCIMDYAYSVVGGAIANAGRMMIFSTSTTLHLTLDRRTRLQTSCTAQVPIERVEFLGDDDDVDANEPLSGILTSFITSSSSSDELTDGFSFGDRLCDGFPDAASLSSFVSGGADNTTEDDALNAALDALEPVSPPSNICDAADGNTTATTTSSCLQLSAPSAEMEWPASGIVRLVEWVSAYLATPGGLPTILASISAEPLFFLFSSSEEEEDTTTSTIEIQPGTFSPNETSLHITGPQTLQANIVVYNTTLTTLDETTIVPILRASVELWVAMVHSEQVTLGELLRLGPLEALVTHWTVLATHVDPLALRSTDTGANVLEALPSLLSSLEGVLEQNSTASVFNARNRLLEEEEEGTEYGIQNGTESSAVMDWRELLLLPTDNSTRGSATTARYGTFLANIKRRVDTLSATTTYENVTQQNTTDLISQLIVPLTKAQSGVVGTLRFEQQIIEMFSDDSSSLQLSDIVVEHLDGLTIRHFMEPTNETRIRNHLELERFSFSGRVKLRLPQANGKPS